MYYNSNRDNTVQDKNIKIAHLFPIKRSYKMLLEVAICYSVGDGKRKSHSIIILCCRVEIRKFLQLNQT